MGDLYGEVLIELITALGAALFVANAFALFRRRSDRADAAKQAVARARPGSPVRSQVRLATTGKLAAAPLARASAYMLLGLFVAIAGIAKITS